MRMRKMDWIECCRFNYISLMKFGLIWKEFCLYCWEIYWFPYLFQQILICLFIKKQLMNYNRNYLASNIQVMQKNSSYADRINANFGRRTIVIGEGKAVKNQETRGVCRTLSASFAKPCMNYFCQKASP